MGGPRKLAIWGEFDILEEKKYPDVACKHCQTFVANARPDRNLLRHLRECKKLSSEERKLWLSDDDESQDEPDETDRSHKRHCVRSDTEQSELSVDVVTTSCQGSPSPVDLVTPSPPGRKGAPSKREVDEYHLLVAKFFYANKLPARLIEDPVTKELLTKFCPKMPLPTPQQIAGPLLDQAFDEMKQETIAALQR